MDGAVRGCRRACGAFLGPICLFVFCLLCGLVDGL